MSSESYQKGKWRADVGVEELASGKFQGFVMLVHEDGAANRQQALHRALGVLDTMDAALAEAKMLARHLLGNL